ncbi:MAG: heme-binding protein [Ramlibacter sp.]|uniref:heme-binding protein n=1 Tax=Ramlibacter sp. TaxID=1917967 RepID=UPI00260E0970|nr:heme-binding protein [Ramlibacter sp.]MDH4375279.1 heme-binding protein [Ramlibacter sp.]
MHQLAIGQRVARVGHQPLENRCIGIDTALTTSALGADSSMAGSMKPVLARYNGPMTPWFMRRNAIWLALQ